MHAKNVLYESAKVVKKQQIHTILQLKESISFIMILFLFKFHNLLFWYLFHLDLLQIFVFTKFSMYICIFTENCSTEQGLSIMSFRRFTL